jgi:hypothetical protein
MKGFEGDITLYEVVWDEAIHAQKHADEAKASAPAATPRPAVAPRPAAAAPR